MARDLFVLGPVLSFRGLLDNGKWGVTALIGIDSGSPIPHLQVDGRRCDAPVPLLSHQKRLYLRYDLSCEMQPQERKVAFGIEDGSFTWHFTVPGAGQAPRIAYVSCNGFSDPGGMRKLVKPENAVWADLLCNHDRDLRGSDYRLDKEQLWHEERVHDQGWQRFHLLVMGGDQIYFDSIWEDIEKLKRWVRLSRSAQLTFKVDKSLEREIENYYLSLYAERWLPKHRRSWDTSASSLDAADAMARIPTLMMWDDHDIFDGWGSYSPEMQDCDLFRVLFRHARRAFWVFQMQQAAEDLPALSGLDRSGVSRQDPQFQPIDWETLRGRDALALPLLPRQPGFTSVYPIGPLALVAADLRTERSRTQIMGSHTWRSLRDWLETLPEGSLAQSDRCQHLIFLSSVPVAHPKLSLVEGLLDTFGQDHVQDSSADDLKDHWSHDDHEGERKRLLETLTDIAERKLLRVSIASGDVHVSAWGSAYRKDIAPTANWAQVQQFTSSAVVHPSLVGVAERLFFHVLNQAASKAQHIDVQFCVQMLLFPGYNRYIMPARNWLALELDDAVSSDARKLWASWRCETETGFSNHLQAVQPAKRA